MHYFSKSLKALQNVQLNDIKNHLTTQRTNNTIDDQLKELREQIKMESEILAKKSIELEAKRAQFDQLMKNDDDTIFTESLDNNN